MSLLAWLSSLFKSEYVLYLERENERLQKQNWELWRALANRSGIQLPQSLGLGLPVSNGEESDPTGAIGPGTIPQREKAERKKPVGGRTTAYVQRKALEQEALQQAAEIRRNLKIIEQNRRAKERTQEQISAMGPQGNTS